MKKFLICLFVFALFVPNIILGESNTIALDSVYDYSTYSQNDYEIYYDGDLTIDVVEDRTITGTNGIWVTGDLTITGNSNLVIDVSEAGIKVDGDFKVLNPSLTINTLSKAYEGNELLDYAYVLDSNSNMAYYLDDTYYDYSFNDILSSLVIKPRQLANINNIDDSHTTLYKNLDGDIVSFKSVNGFLVNTEGDDINVSYDENLLTYYVKIWNDFDENNVSFNFVELLFNKNEWGKTLDYEVIEANNFYRDIDTLDPYLVTGERLPMGYVGFDYYSYSNECVSIDSVSDYMLFVAKGQNNKIVLKVYGNNDEYRYINLVVNKKEEEKKHHDYTVVNTGIR